MWFAYMDEAGNTGRNFKDAAQPIHLILTVAIDETQVMRVHDHVRDVARHHCPSDCRKDDFEFHGQALFSGRGSFAAMSPEKRIEIYDDILAGIDSAEAQIVIRGVHKQRLQQRYPKPFHPHDIALMFTIESLERMAKERNCRMLLVADEAREIEDAALRDLANYQEVGTSWGWNTEQIDCIIDTIHFVPSQTNPAIQLADCAAFIAGRHRRIQEGIVPPNPAVTDLWERRLEPFLVENSVWYPAG